MLLLQIIITIMQTFLLQMELLRKLKKERNTEKEYLICKILNWESLQDYKANNSYIKL